MLALRYGKVTLPEWQVGYGSDIARGNFDNIKRLSSVDDQDQGGWSTPADSKIPGKSKKFGEL
jgi:hypothetical protein